MQQLKTGEAYINFTGTLRSKATEKQYLFLIQRYAAFRKTLDLDKIVDEDSKNQTLAVARIREFLLSIQAELSTASVDNYRRSLKHFYEMNDIPLNWKKIAKFARKEDANAGIIEKDRAYSHDEIQVILQHAASPKIRAIILLLASSGIRVGAVQSIKIKHLTRIPKYNCYQLLIYPGNKDEYTTFCTPEAAGAIDSYLSSRERAGEKLNDQSPLFRTDFYSSDIFKVRNNIKPISTEGVSKAIMVALKGAGLFWTQIPTESDRHRRHDVQRNHGFRKFANTQMVISEVNGAAKEMLLGHSIGLDDKYYRPTAAQLLEEYTKAIDLLTINEENRLRKKVEELTIESSDISIIKQHQKKLEDRDKQILDLKKKLDTQERERQDETVLLCEKIRAISQRIENMENEVDRFTSGGRKYSGGWVQSAERFVINKTKPLHA